MKTGDIVTDSRANAWTLSALLGEGVWGKSWLVRDHSGQQRVLKAPYSLDDLPPAAAGQVQIMRECAREQAEILSQKPAEMITLLDRIILPSGAIALLFPHYPTTLRRQLLSGIPITEALQELLGVTTSLVAKAHGNLRPSNILIDASGEPFLSDIATPSFRVLQVQADQTQPERRRWSPPDRIASDTWAVCQALYSAIQIDEGASDASLASPPSAGLDKISLATIRDRAVARLKRDGANTRFVNRTAERLSTLLARGLSPESDPSPPYRFLKPSDLKPRLSEVVSLIQPGIESVGKLLLGSAAVGSVFSGSGPVGFTVSVGATEGVNNPDDLACGVRLVDLDATGDGRVSLEDAQFAVNRHPSGRFRFEFNLPEVAPGRYAVRVAFSIKDSGENPVVAEGAFEVRPPPGYVPPPKEKAEAPLSFMNPSQVEPATLKPIGLAPPPQTDDEFDEDAATVQMELPSNFFDSDPGGETDPDAEEGGEIIHAFPRPLAPTAPGTAVDLTPVPAPIAPPPAPRPVLAAVPTPAPTEPGPTEAYTLGEDPPSMTMPVIPGPAHPDTSPSVVPSIAPTPSIAPPPSPAPLGTEGASWAATQEGEQEFFDDAALPGSSLPSAGGEDLMGEKKPSILDQIQERTGLSIQPDSTTFIVVVVAGCFIAAALLMVLLKSC